MALKVTQTVAPAVEPITRQEAKDWARITTTADDTLVDTLITASRRAVERMTSRALINQTWTLTLDRFPGSDREPILVPRPPLSSVTSVGYLDTDGASQTWASTDYTVDTHSEPARIVPAFNESYPDTRDVVNAVTVTFVAGYGSTQSAVPDDIRTATNVLTATLYNHREMLSADGAITTVPETVDLLLADYQIHTDFSLAGA